MLVFNSGCVYKGNIVGKFLKMKQQARVHCGVSDTPDWLSVGLKSQGFRQEELHIKQVL